MLLVYSRRLDPISIVVTALADSCPLEDPNLHGQHGGLDLATRRGLLRESHGGLRNADGQGESHDGRRRRVLMRWFGVGAVLMFRWALVAYN